MKKIIVVKFNVLIKKKNNNNSNQKFLKKLKKKVMYKFKIYIKKISSQQVF